MSIDPRVAFWFGVWTSILLLVASGTINFTGALPDAWVPIITKWCAILGAINSTILTAASGYSSSKTGPMVNLPSPSSASTVVKILIAAFALSLFLASGPAMAQARKPALTGNIGADIKTDLAPAPANGQPALTGNIEKDATALWKKIQSLTKADLTYAIAKAKAAKTNAADVRLQCLQAISDANDQANGAGLTNADGTPMVRPDPALVTSIEDAAELVDNLSPQGKLFTSCAGAAQMFKTNALALINSIVTGAAGIALLPAGL